MSKISNAGMFEWGWRPSNYGPGRLNGLDLFGDKGYLLAGSINEVYTPVLKTECW
jgi:hypothetical protein